MDKDEIKQNIQHLPLAPIGREVRSREVWEGDENGAHFTVSRHVVPLEHHTPIAMVALTVSGDKAACDSLADQFMGEYGMPYDVSPQSRDGLPGTMYAWLEHEPVHRVKSATLD